MTSAKTSDEQTPLASFIRDLYAVIAYYTANPGHPLPGHVFIHHTATADVIERLAVDHHRTPYVVGGGRTQLDYPVPGVPRVSLMIREPLQGYGS